MKLKNKLIPISSILATSVIAVPTVLTSCSQGMVMVDSTKPFTPDFAPYDESMIISQYQATQKYVEFAKKNPKSVAEDIRYGMRQSWFDMFDEIETESSYDWAITNAKITNYTFGISNLSFGENTVYFAGEEPMDYPSISFNMKVHLECEIDSYDDEGTDGQYDVTDLYTIDADVSYKNMIFFAEYVNPILQIMAQGTNNNPLSSQLGWYISFMDPNSDFVALKNSSNWKITSDVSLTKQEIWKQSGVKQNETTRVYNKKITLSKYLDMQTPLKWVMFGIQSLWNGDAESWLNDYDSDFMCIYASLFNIPTYYFGKVYSTPTIISQNKLGNFEASLLADEYKLEYDAATSTDKTIRGWTYRTDLSFLADPTLSNKYDIGNITLAEDEDLYLPEARTYDPNNKRALHIIGNDIIWDYTWYEQDGELINIRIPAEIVSAEDKETPDGYSAAELAKYKQPFMFTFTKRLIKVNVPIYDVTDKSNPKLYMNVISTVDIRDPYVNVMYK